MVGTKGTRVSLLITEALENGNWHQVETTHGSLVGPTLDLQRMGKWVIKKYTRS